MGGTALGASGRSNNGLKLDVKTGKLSLWRLFPTFTFTFTHGAEVWGVQLAAKAACCHRGSAGSAAEKLQLSYLRHLLGVRQSTPNAALLAETGERPLWQCWLRRAAKLWNKTLEERPGSLLQQALLSSVQLADGAHPLAHTRLWNGVIILNPPYPAVSLHFKQEN